MIPELEGPIDREKLRSLLASAWTALGCPPEKTEELTTQLMRRARQLADKTGRSEPEAVRHLWDLVRRSYETRQREAPEAIPAGQHEPNSR